VAQQVRCDGADNLYLRIVPSARYRVESQPIVKLSPKGETLATYSAQNAADPLDLVDFNVTLDGHVYGLGADRKDLYLVTFNSDGRIKDRNKFDASFTPAKIVAFQSGHYLVAGSELGTREHSANHTAYTGLFDESGKLLKKIALADDEKIKTAADSDDRNFVGEGASPQNLAIAWGVASPGYDGNVYLMRRVDPAVVYVISAGGEVIRRLSVPSPEPGMLPESLQSTADGLVVSFTNDKSTSIIVANPENGMQKAEYSGPQDVGVALGCYAGNKSFLFLGSQKGQMLINRVEPK
jgi:hypothetical protein